MKIGAENHGGHRDISGMLLFRDGLGGVSLPILNPEYNAELKKKHMIIDLSSLANCIKGSGGSETLIDNFLCAREWLGVLQASHDCPVAI